MFVSVGIDPPTVEFPRTGAEIDCDERPDAVAGHHGIGTIPYPEERFGRLRVFEETGRQQLGAGRRRDPDRPAAAAAASRSGSVDAAIGPATGEHLVYFFQAPDPPAQATTEAEIDAHFRGLRERSRTRRPAGSVDVKPPPRSALRNAAVAGGLHGCGVTGTHAQPRRRQLRPPEQRRAGARSARCRTRTSTCASVAASTRRAPTPTATGRSALPLPPGWNKVTLAQVADSRGGRRLERELPVERGRRRRAYAGRPGHQRARPTSPSTRPARKGAEVFYDVTAVSASRRRRRCRSTASPRRARCSASARTLVSCPAPTRRPAPVGLAELRDHRRRRSAGDQGARRSSSPRRPARWARIVSYDVTADDAVDGPLPVECVPASPALFPLDEVDAGRLPRRPTRSKQTAAATFKVRVVDTTPPALCALPDIKVASDVGRAARSSTFATCATDIVDGAGRRHAAITRRARSSRSARRWSAASRSTVTATSRRRRRSPSRSATPRRPCSSCRGRSPRSRPAAAARASTTRSPRPTTSIPNPTVSARRRRGRCSRSARRPSTARRRTPPATSARGRSWSR